MKIHVHWAILEDTCLLAYETFASFTFSSATLALLSCFGPQRLWVSQWCPYKRHEDGWALLWEDTAAPAGRRGSEA